ncbi:MAG: acetyl-CoA carboxylase carboxyltransferase subunit alpha [Clostridiales bacterium]|nr:acetyl-CoA carboxylase carboxyltransferase subunit alpha [Clostridiales bacterium]
MKQEIIKKDAWDIVMKARANNRPVGRHYIDAMFDEFIELHGDRLYGDDRALIGGLATLDGIPVTVIAQHKGSSLEERVSVNFGMAHPEGYRKSMRLMKQAEKFHRPVICIIDTNGAYPGIGAEERGQGTAIADNLFQLSSLKTPVISIIIGEGGSGGALALSLGDHLIMLENSIFSVITPEGCATILYKDASKAEEVARHLKLTSDDLMGFGLIDSIIKEPKEFTKDTMSDLVSVLKKEIVEKIYELIKLDTDELVIRRQEKHLANAGV